MRTTSFLFILFLFLSCRNNNPKQQGVMAPEGAETVNPKTYHSWRQISSYTHQKDTTFQIELLQKANELQLQLGFSESGRFLDEVQKVRDILKEIAVDYDLKQVSKIFSYHVNNRDLSADFLSINAIQDNIRSNEKKGWNWIDFTVVSDNASKSRLLKHFTNLFLVYGLQPTDYLMEKCYYRKEEGDYRMNCTHSVIDLAPVE